MAASPAAATAATPLYPDIKTLAPRDLRVARVDVSDDGSGNFHNVLRFSNTVWNAGQGKLLMRGQIDPITKDGTAYQRVYDTAGGYTEYPVGRFYYHAVHNHYHYEGWGKYQLWTKADYDSWIASGRTQGSPKKLGAKTTSCVLDEEIVKHVAGTPYPKAFQFSGCQPDATNVLTEGMSVGWGDTYGFNTFQQWVDLDQDTLSDGDYVLRSVSDPQNQIYESANKADASREGQPDNEAITPFTVKNGAIVDSNPPTGTVTINDLAAQTTSSKVTVKVLGRDDVSGVDQVKVSNDGVNWATYTYTPTDTSTTMSIAWDLADTRYGGSTQQGIRTVYVQFHDRAGKLSSTVSDTIQFGANPGPKGAYATAIIGDGPVSYWRLGESSGASAIDELGVNPGAYAGGPTLGAPSLLVSDTGNSAMGLDGVDDRMRAPGSSSLNLTSALTLEAWIKPTALPASGQFASVMSKSEAYSLQFNGPQLELTIIQGSTRKRLKAPVGAIAAGTTYHVVGTYDGSTQRLYVNGAQVASAPLTGAANVNSNGLVVGSWNGSQEFFKGTIDEVALYNKVLSPSQVSQHYTTGGQPSPTVRAPTALTATAVSTSSIDLKWTDNASNETSYVVERSTDAAFSAPTLINLAADATSYTDSGLSAATTYYYRVKAKNATDTSGYSNAANATTASSQPPSGYAAAVLDDGPVSYWRLGEPGGTVAADERGANPGSYANAPGLSAPSLIDSDANNRAVSFDGSNDQVLVPDSNSLDLTSGLTLEAWIKPTSLPSAGGFASVSTKTEAYSLQFNGPQIEFTVIQGGNRRRLKAPAGAIATGSTYHLVGTYDGSTQRLYINGAEVANAPLSGGANTNSKSFFIGSWNGSSEFFKGTIDDVAVYDKALSASSVSAHYSAAGGQQSAAPTRARSAPSLAAPSDLQATAASDSEIDLTWSDNSSDETGFVVERSADRKFRTVDKLKLDPDTTEYTDTGLRPGKTYYYRVRAKGDGATSEYSDSANATTEAASPDGAAKQKPERSTNRNASFDAGSVGPRGTYKLIASTPDEHYYLCPIHGRRSTGTVSFPPRVVKE